MKVPLQKKILVVDDDKDILEALRAILVSEKFKVRTEIQSKHINRDLSEFKPDLIVLDILLSGEDGREICKRLKRSEDTKKIPVIMLSAHPDVSKTVKNYGADDFIAKPFDIENLLKVIRKFT